ncbi:mandelate racemase [Paenibacillus baekrokdamisoli]|uniref:Mandelate racemase n=1 Tax=Paenibacillus baekrokdamisoli TaxID=1712516 RepID=A0A3G9IN70_9BACL|nr:mandelate racemase/muconate lactonizing enzyme family protein [Paenibacillus baekrokdamisoli]MBB3072015.1 D-galactarolactone cycloisomerase [Paenibacillus baekrokdamisoli]BBH20317.1 mandelate racemase [Paenibacillus baekrokdamisoli]
MKITAVESFTVKLDEQANAQDHRYTTLGMTRIRTDEGITGYGFRTTDEEVLRSRVRPRLIGSNPLNIMEHMNSGALAGCATVENALWDIAGKAAGLPIRNLLGSASERIPYYLTCVWPGNTDQSHLTIEEQADQIALYHAMGHTRFKIRGWRPDPMDDVRVFEAVRKKCGSRDKIELMIDRTAHLPGWVWTYEQALEVARGLEAVDATWLEEPFARDDIASYRRLASEVDIPITGGEFSNDLTVFRDYLSGSAVDIIQPDVFISGGIWATRKVAVLAEAFGKPCVLHGTNGPDLAASLQVASTIQSCRMMEFALIFPPLTPEEMWEPLNRILKYPTLYKLKDGYIELPTAPGLGIELDEEAIEALRVNR